MKFFSLFQLNRNNEKDNGLSQIALDVRKNIVVYIKIFCLKFRLLNLRPITQYGHEFFILSSLSYLRQGLEMSSGVFKQCDVIF